MKWSSLRSCILNEHIRVIIEFEDATFDLFVHEDVEASELLLYLRASIKVSWGQSISLLYQDIQLIGSSVIGNTYNRYKVEDALRLICLRENTFGREFYTENAHLPGSESFSI